MDKLALRPAEVADVIGLSRARTYQLIATGDLPSIYIGGMRRVAVEQLREWLARKLEAQRREQQLHDEPRPAEGR